MKRDTSPIDPAAIYDTTLEFCDGRASRNWHARLRRRGFVRSPSGEAYYHPDHWKAQSIGGVKSFRGPGDHWIFNDSFKARTKAAKEWLLRTIEE